MALHFICPRYSALNWSGIFLRRAQALRPDANFIFPPEDVADNVFHAMDIEGARITQRAIEETSPGDTLVFFDVQGVDPGPLTDGRRKLIGMVRGGPYERYDPYAQRPERYRKLFEKQLACYDEIWVTTLYHSTLLQGATGLCHRSIKVVGSALDVGLLGDNSEICDFHHPRPVFEAKDGILFTSRPDPDKGFDIAQELSRSGLVRIERFDSRARLYSAIARSRFVVIPARKETFGQLAAESVLLGTIPIIPRDFNYPEIYGEEWPFYLTGPGTEIDHTSARNRLDRLYKETGQDLYNEALATARASVLAYNHTFDTAIKRVV